jgi:O-antigen/teichoic acid export membrane protein
MFGLIMFATVLSFQGPVIIVSRVLGGAAVALLVTTRTLANVIRTVVMMLNNTLWPELTHLDAIGASETLRLTHRLTAVCFTMLSAAFAAALWFEGPEVTTVWTRGTLVLDVWLLRLFLLVLVLQAPWLASSLFTISSSRHGNLAYCYLGSAVLPLVASAVLIRPIGLLAVPFGTLLGEAIACYHFVVKDTCRVLNEDYPRYAVRLWAGVIAMLLGPWGAGWLGHYFAFGPAPLRWLEVGSMTTLAALLCAWGVALPKNDRVRLLHWLRSKSSSQNGASVSVLA